MVNQDLKNLKIYSHDTGTKMHMFSRTEQKLVWEIGKYVQLDLEKQVYT